MGRKKSSASLAIDSTTKPFWTSGDAITGCIRLVVESKISFTSVQISLACVEKGKVSERALEREKMGTKKPSKPRDTKKKTFQHYESHQLVVDAQNIVESQQTKTQVLEQGEYMFPFSVELNDDINQCPPHAPVTTRGGLELGVRWYLEVTIKRSGRFKPSIKEKLMVPVYPRSLNTVAKVSTDQLDLDFGEMSGQEIVNSKTTLKGMFKPKKELARIHATLRYPAKGIVQPPKSPPLQLAVHMDTGIAHLHLVSVKLRRVCDCRVRDATDQYITYHDLGSITVTRRITSKSLQLSNLIQSFRLPDTMPPAFSAKMIRISYFLELNLEYTIEADRVLRKFKLSTPIDIISPHLCWAGPNKSLVEARQLSFSTPKYSANQSARSGKTASTGVTGTSGATMSSFGSLDSSEIRGPSRMISSWLKGWS